MKACEVYEDNAGGLYIVAKNPAKDDVLGYYRQLWEQSSGMDDMISFIQGDTKGREENILTEDQVDEIKNSDRLIALYDGAVVTVIYRRMGKAGKKYFGITV
ncbi:hypothetical protein KKC67_03465 [Patescibacteria group bacterium]|nr:hypothetical protein [Patescibacteria group bacterium]MBU1992038.1 hypothetical protein [Patescibacteria group bacterium]MBU2101746.1 hypothetical protein [Patescibacteria group bacterium]MBU2251795.1 hypothetical protein [Candidatus Omnitrophota bacterium]